MTRTARVLAVFSAAGAFIPMTGCYKAEYEAEKSRADDLDKRHKDLQGELERTKSDLQAVTGRAATAEKQLAEFRSGSTLVCLTPSSGQAAVQDSIRWDGQRWVRHGDCVRPGGVVRFDNGRLLDQTIFLQTFAGRPLVTGAVKSSKPDGDWIWFDEFGRPATKEVWKDGRLAELHRSNTGSGTLRWDRLGRPDREAWIRTVSAGLRDLPELVRDYAPAVRPAAGASQPGSR